MTDREKLLGLLNEYKIDSIEAIFSCFLDVYRDDISVRTMYSLMKTLNAHFEHKVDKLEMAKFVANERAGYIKNYLMGKMFNNEEEAKQYVDCQIENAQAIINACRF